MSIIQRPAGRFLIAFIVGAFVALLLQLEAVREAYTRPLIKVAWAAGVTDAQRAALERTFELSNPRFHEQRTWIYEVNNTSPAFLQRLVQHPAVQDTDGLDRSTFVLREADPRPRARAQLGISAALLLVVASLCAWLDSSRLAWIGRLLAVFTRGVPELPAAALGYWRICLGALLFLAVAAEFGRLVSGPAISSLPGISPRGLYGLTLTALGLGAIGLFTSASMVAATAGLAALVLTTSADVHEWGIAVLALAGLSLTPAGDAVSCDERLRRLRRQPSRGGRVGRAHGFGLWLIGLLVGVVFAAAAYAKLENSGFAWVTSGAVRYHFLEDYADAPVRWGVEVAVHPWLPVLLSFGALAIEALFITIVFFRSEVVRALYGLAAVGLLGGFLMFQGVFWPVWWSLLSGFLPWGTIASAAGTRRRREPGTDNLPIKRFGLTRLQIGFSVFIVVQQLVASRLGIEREPFLSNYPMYSNTFSSIETFYEDRRWWRFQSYSFEIELPQGERVDVTGSLSEEQQFVFVQAYLQSRDPTGPSESARQAIAELMNDVLRLKERNAIRLVLYTDERRLDTEQARFVVARRHIKLCWFENQTPPRVVIAQPST